MRISDWSSDVCSSDLAGRQQQAADQVRRGRRQREVGGAAAAFGGSEVKARRQVLQRAVVELATVLEPARRHPVLRNLAPADRERPPPQPPLEEPPPALLPSFGASAARPAPRTLSS